MKTLKLEKTYGIFDLEAMENKDIPEVGECNVAETAEEALAAIGGDQAVLTSAINDYLRSQKLSEMRDHASSQGADRSVVLNFIKPFRLAAPYSEIADRAEQTKKILADVKGNAMLLNIIKSASAAAQKAAIAAEKAGDAPETTEE